MHTDGRSEYWDIVKGLGIVAIVLGHAAAPIASYLYLYHLALFFFIAGFLYKDRNSFDFFQYFGNRMRGLWLPFVAYAVVFALFHNLFFLVDIYSDQITDGYQPRVNDAMDFYYGIKGALFMQGLDPLCAPLWFVITLMATMLLFCAIRYSAVRYFTGIKSEIWTTFLVSCFCGLGFVCISSGIRPDYSFDLAMAVLPITYAGFAFKAYWNRIPLKWGTGFAALAVMIAVRSIFHTHIDLSAKHLSNPPTFLLVSLCGIYCNLVLAKKMLVLQRVAAIFAHLGRRSFHIMALHFLAFKFASLLYVLCLHKPYFWIARYPIINQSWWLAYALAGLSLPVLFIDGTSYLKNKYKLAR